VTPTPTFLLSIAAVLLCRGSPFYLLTPTFYRLCLLHSTSAAIPGPNITGQTAAGVDTYLARLASPEYAAHPALARGVARAAEAGMPAIAVSPMFGQLMSILVLAMRATRVLEIGTLGG
jgi:hypothetical protein